VEKNPGERGEVRLVKLNRDILRKLSPALRIEIEENAQRKPLTQSELAHEQRRILQELRKHKTPGARTDLKRKGKATSGKTLPEVHHLTSIVGKLYGESRTQVEKRQAVVAAAKDEPEKFGKLLDTMNRTGRVNGVHKLWKVAKQAEAINAEPPPLPGRGPYRVIVADLPWPCARQDDPSHHGARPYPTMTIEEMCALDVASIAHKDCILWLWTTNQHMREAFTVLDAWEFEHRVPLTWDKGKIGLGDWLRGQTEHCLMATRGKPTVTLSAQSTLLRAPARAHSQKPVEFYGLVESLCPAPRYADLFSRYRHSDKWDCHGDEATQLEAAE
jgi:N6-adenosine-specific RNA methylase IME4